MKKISIAFLAAVSLASFGCKKGGGGGASDIVAKMGEFKDRMCACKDKACTDKVTEDMSKWSQEHAKAGADKEAKPSEDDAKKMMAVSDEMNKCLQKTMTDAAGAAGGGAAAGGAAAGGAAEPAAGGAAAGGAAAGGAAEPAAGGAAAGGGAAADTGSAGSGSGGW